MARNRWCRRSAVGAILLAEELYETRVVALVLPAGHAGAAAARRRSASSVPSSAAKKHSILSSWSVMS